MPILIDRGPGGCSILAGKDTAAERLQARRHPAGSEWIEIGLVNNMPEAALEATEQQFLELLGAAAGDSWVHLRFFSLAGVPRSERGRSYLGQFYHDAADLRRAELDGLIVTGTEPKAADLADEPYWGAFTQLVDWAANNTISTVWSCLAAHAAVLHLDGIARVPLREKCIGVFACDNPAEHLLTLNLPSRAVVPHARWNALPEETLTANGYQVLTRSPAAGVDSFVRQNFGGQNLGRQEQSLFLFFQGHPEYGYRGLAERISPRRRPLSQGRARPLSAGMPRRHSFSMPPRKPRSARFRAAERTWRQRSEELLADFPVPANPALSANWQPFAVAIYRNWLSILSAQKRRHSRPARYMAGAAAGIRLRAAPAVCRQAPGRPHGAKRNAGDAAPALRHSPRRRARTP